MTTDNVPNRTPLWLMTPRMKSQSDGSSVSSVTGFLYQSGSLLSCMSAPSTAMMSVTRSAMRAAIHQQLT